MKGKNILVIGGAGFVGSSLCEKLVSEGAFVHSYDNYFTGTMENHVANVIYHQGEARHINSHSFDAEFDYVYHLGEYSRVEQSFEDIDTVFDFNHASIYQVLKFVRRYHSKLIYSGSSTKFGDDGRNGEESPYAWTKKTNADLVRVFCGWFDINFAITYFYNVYGEREISGGKYATVIAKFIQAVKNGEKRLTVVKPGTQRRNFTHIDDIVNGLILVGKRGEGDGFGIGSDESFSIMELVELLECEVDYLDARRGNRMLAPVNSEKTKTLGWRASKSLRAYLADRLND